MKSRNLLIAAVLLASLSGAVWWSKQHPDAGKPKTDTPASPKVADIPAAQVESITIARKAKGAITVQRKDNRWSITEPEAYPADQDAVSSMVSALSPLTASNLVEDGAKDIDKYGLNAPSLTVTVHQTKGKTTTLAFGDDVPTGSDVYARANGETKVYAVSTSSKSSFDKGTNDLRDRRLLTIDNNTVTGIEVASAKSSIGFGKNNSNEWQIVKPQPRRAEGFQVDDLLRKLTEAKMDLSGSDADAAKAQSAWTTGQKVAIASVTGGSGTQSLDVRKVKDDYYARSSAVKGVYKIASDLGKQLEKPGDDYRNKKLFDFGFSDPTQFTLSGAAGDRTCNHSGNDWKCGGQTMDASTVQAFLDKARDITASGFADTGFGSPSYGITIVSNSGKRTEKAEFAKSSDGYLARREGDSSLYRLETATGDELASLGRAIKPATQAKKK